MRMLIGTIVAASFLVSGQADGAGVQFFTLSAADGSPGHEGAIWYPCASPNATVRLRRVEATGVENCAIEGEDLPLIVISHGARGWYGGHHDTAEALADAGFVVAAVTHHDRGRAWQTARPETIKRLIDHMVGMWPGNAQLDPDRIGFFGFSRGGYTGLIVIGGVPDFSRIVEYCRNRSWEPICDPLLATPATGTRPATRNYVHDPRVKAAVIAAPLGLVFSSDGLKAVRVPVQLWRPENDVMAPHPHNAEAVSMSLPEPPDYRVVAGAGHFSFLAPCTELQAEAAPPLCEDGPGFDREAFHRTFNAEVIGFFRSAFD